MGRHKADVIKVYGKMLNVHNTLEKIEQAHILGHYITNKNSQLS